MRTIALVSCGAAKTDQAKLHAVMAQDLYTGGIFQQARAWAIRHADEWRILSAKHGLLYPDAAVRWYDVGMKDLSRVERADWARRVRMRLQHQGLWGERLVLLAGKDYEGAVAGAPYVEKPLEHLGTGYRRQWFKENT
jgi:hypothetical protein